MYISMYTYIYKYIYVCVCARVCVCACVHIIAMSTTSVCQTAHVTHIEK